MQTYKELNKDELLDLYCFFLNRFFEVLQVCKISNYVWVWNLELGDFIIWTSDLYMYKNTGFEFSNLINLYSRLFYLLSYRAIKVIEPTDIGWTA
jgi:hypothetical protein